MEKAISVKNIIKVFKTESDETPYQVALEDISLDI